MRINWDGVADVSFSTSTDDRACAVSFIIFISSYFRIFIMMAMMIVTYKVKLKPVVGIHHFFPVKIYGNGGEVVIKITRMIIIT